MDNTQHYMLIGTLTRLVLKHTDVLTALGEYYSNRKGRSWIFISHKIDMIITNENH